MSGHDQPHLKRRAGTPENRPTHKIFLPPFQPMASRIPNHGLESPFHDRQPSPPERLDASFSVESSICGKNSVVISYSPSPDATRTMPADSGHRRSQQRIPAAPFIDAPTLRASDERARPAQPQTMAGAPENRPTHKIFRPPFQPMASRIPNHGLESPCHDRQPSPPERLDASFSVES